MQNGALRLLIVEDSENDALLLTEHLRRSGLEIHYEVVENPADFAEALKRGDWDVVLSDYRLPTFSALDALASLRDSGRDLPFIVVSGTIGDDLAVNAMRAGAHDYVMKDNLARLVPAIQREIDEAEGRRRHRLVEDAYQTLVENSLQGLVILQDDVVVFANNATADILGVARSDMAGLGAGAHWSVVHPADRDAMRRQAEEILECGRAFRTECRLLHKSGEPLWTEISGSRTSVGHRPAVQIALADISERKTRERELQVLTSLSDAARGTRTRQEFVRTLLNQVLVQLPAAAVALAAPASVDGSFIFEAAVGSWRHSLPGVQDTAPDGANATVSARGERVTGGARELLPQGITERGDDGVRMVAVLPLQVEEENLGLLWVGRGCAITEGDRRILDAVAGMAAAALNRITLQDELRRRLQRLHALRSIDLAITTSRDLGLVFDVMFEQISNELGVDAVRVFKRPSGADHVELVAGRGEGASGSERETVHFGSGMVGAVARDRTISQTDLGNGSQPLSDRERDLALRGFVTHIGLPLLAGPELRGVLEILSRERLQLDAEGRAFLETVAWQAAIAIDGAMLLDELKLSNEELAAAYESTLEGWARALELRDQETEGHTRRVTDLTVRLAARFGIEGEALANVRRGAILHDIGKMAIPDHILLKPGPLDDEEWDIMRRHTEYAVRIISPIKHLQSALTIPASHHERWNGKGYPEGLRGEEIPLAARVFAVVDVWDALRSDRPYRKAVPEDEVRAYIQEQSEVQFDPQVVREFLAMIDEDCADG